MTSLVPLALVAANALASGAVGAPAGDVVAPFVPADYVAVETFAGDLNGDDRPDYVVVIKGTDPAAIVQDEFRGTLDRNRRGLVVILSGANGYSRAVDNRACFSSENEDGGVYFAPELDVSVGEGSIRIHYGHGRYGWWTYRFRHRNSDFELVGFDRSENRGPVVERTVSINFLTRRMRTRQYADVDANGDDATFEETWTTFSLPQPIRLRDIRDFDDLYVESWLDGREGENSGTS